MRSFAARGLAIAMVLLAIAPALAAEWGSIAPGKSTIESVRATYGQPTRQNTQKVDGYDTTEWLYEGDRAPRGLQRLAVDFGLLTPAGYRPDLVRTMRLDPVPGVFTRETVLLGWGKPHRVGKEGDAPLFFYQDGLVVFFDKDGWLASRLLFTPPQPNP
ncbi:MAG: hypothetical protein HYU41_21160 [Candidatus Rokubacteria bacterium]|nr:hypothetical protein [Candidatus Rokubacteria bacterium]